jgi:hypothetical protein
MQRIALAASCLAAVGSVVSGASLPADCRVRLTLEGASWRYGDPRDRGDVTLCLNRRNGAWVAVLTADARYQSAATHDGYVVQSRSDAAAGETLLIRVRFRRDKWNDVVSEGAFRLRFAVAEGRCAGSWQGVLHGRKAEGVLTGVVRSLRIVQNFAPPARGEHPRLLIRRSQIPALRRRAGTQWGRKVLAQLRADTSSPVAQGMAYVLTGEKAYAEATRDLIEKAIGKRQWHHIGVAHAPAFTAVEHLIAYDLIHDACDEAFRRRMRDMLSDKPRFYYWGAYNSQFNNKRTSNWSLMYRSACGLAALSLLESSVQPAETTPPAELPRLSPSKDLAVGRDVPVVRLDADKPIGAWLFAGPAREERGEDAFGRSGGLAAARPEAGMRLGDCAFRKLEEPHIRDGIVDLAALTGRVYFRACYLYCIIDVPKAGFFQLEGPKDFKGKRHRLVCLAGRTLPLGQVLHLAAGRYPLLVRIWTEPVGNWEPLRFSLRLAPLTEKRAEAWHARRAGAAVVADRFCGESWPRAVSKRSRWNLEALRWATVAAREAEGYFLKGLGDFGWNQEGEAYTRHAVRLAMPFALCYRNSFGHDIPGAERLGMMLALATAATVYGDDGAMMQSFNVGGGPMDVDLYARGFGFLPERFRPAVMWSWNRSLALAAAGKLRDPHGVIAHHGGLSEAMLFLNYPLDLAPGNPAGVLGRVVVDSQKGGYVLRNRWKNGDDCVVQVFANSNQAGGSWVSNQGGTFRITGLGHQWVVRGQGYGNGGSGRALPDFCKYQNMVDVEEHLIGSSPQAWTTHFARIGRDGSGSITLNMDEVYVHQQKQRDRRGRWRAVGEKDLGIRAVRAIAVDYAGRCGAPCLVAVADRLTGTRGRNTWQLATRDAHKVAVSDNTFAIAAADGASLVGTVVRPTRATIRVEAYQHVHEINYHGRHSRRPFKRKAVLVDGTDRDQDFLIVMTLQRGAAPRVTVGADAEVAVGPSTGSPQAARVIRFDGRKIVLE